MEKRIIIGIQCRLASTRFPEKSIKLINDNGLTCVGSLLDNVDKCNEHMSKKSGGLYTIKPIVVLLVPDNEVSFWLDFAANRRPKPIILSGHLTDVLSRYLHLLEQKFDAVVRLTADCPNVPPLAINKAIFTLIHHRLDYISNVWEGCRTAIDGHDIEVMSYDALQWLKDNATEPDEREHVTIAIRKRMPQDLRKAALIQKEDMSHIKLCVDTEHEFNECKMRFNQALLKKEIAAKKGLGIYDY